MMRGSAGRRAPHRSISVGGTYRRLVVLLLLIFLTPNAALANPAGANAEPSVVGPTIYFAPNPVEVGWGLTREVDVIVANIEGLYAAEVRIAFPNSLVHVQDADPAVSGVQVRDGDIFAGRDTYVVQNKADNATGVIEYIVSITGSATGINGTGKLLTIPLQPVALGDAVMSFVEVILCEPDGTSINATIVDEQADIDVVSQTSTPTLPPGVTPTATLTPTPSSTATATHTPIASDTPTHTPIFTDTPTATVNPTATPTSTKTPLVAHVAVIPEQQQLQEGDDDIVQITIGNVCDLYLYSVRVDYNGTVLDVEDADSGKPGIQVFMGDVFDGFAYQVQQNAVTDDEVFGQVRFLASIDSGSPSGFCGDGVLFWIVFRGMAAGSSTVSLLEVTLADHAGSDISRTLAHGQIEVLAGPTAVPTHTPTSTATHTASPTPTDTYTPTATATMTPTFTATATPSSTPTSTEGPTPTFTATSTEGPSPTPTHTWTPTLTPTSTETPSPTPTNTPSSGLVTPTPVCSDLIGNGGFETVQNGQASPWVRQGSTIYTSNERHSGNYSAWLGGYNNADDGLYQTISIPAHPEPGETLTEATLSYWRGVLTEEKDHAFDFMWVRIRDANGGLLEELEIVSDEDADGEWHNAEFDVSAYEGQTIRVAFEAETEGSNPTSFYVDDVKLIICEVLQPTPTATASNTPTISPTPTHTEIATRTPTITPTPVIVELQYDELGYSNCYDAYMEEWDPTKNNGHTGALQFRTDGVKRPVLLFDVSHLPSNVTVTDARLWLQTTHYKSHQQNPTMSVYGLRRSWEEMQVTWEIARTGESWSAGGANSTINDRDATPVTVRAVPDTSTWYDFEITSLVQAWLDGSRSNNGVILIASGNTVEMSFWSSEYSIKDVRPKLVIAYTYGGPITPGPTNTPKPTSAATPTPTATSAPGGTEHIFQTGYLGYDGVDDTYISQWEPTDNYGNNVTMIVRQGDIRGALVRFDLSALPSGATIHEATLGLYAVNRSNSGGTSVAAYRVLRPWAETQATWERATVGNTWAVAGCNLPGTDRSGTATDTFFADAINIWHDWDLTTLVQGWVADPASNYGVILKASGQISVEYLYATSGYWWAPELSPRLVVRYSTP